jgi:hypothetical protein
MGKRRGIYMVLVGKPEGKKPLGIPGSRWEKKMGGDLGEGEGGGGGNRLE